MSDALSLLRSRAVTKINAFEALRYAQRSLRDVEQLYASPTSVDAAATHAVGIAAGS